MSRQPENRIQKGWLAGLTVLLALSLACSTDSPTAPDQVAPPGPAPAFNAWVITVSVDPEEILVGSPDPALVAVRVESRDVPGAVPPSGTTMVVSTSLGELVEPGSEAQTAAVIIDRGRASVFLFAGEFAGPGTVSAQLEGSVGRRGFAVVNEEVPVDPFILGISPNTGPASGGTRVTITGTAFAPPLRVLFGDKLATVVSATETNIVAVTPPGDIESEECDDDGDTVNGSKSFDTPVQVSVENSDGTLETLDNAFTYTVPNSGVCVND